MSQIQTTTTLLTARNDTTFLLISERGCIRRQKIGQDMTEIQEYEKFTDMNGQRTPWQELCSRRPQGIDEKDIVRFQWSPKMGLSVILRDGRIFSYYKKCDGWFQRYPVIPSLADVFVDDCHFNILESERVCGAELFMDCQRDPWLQVEGSASCRISPSRGKVRHFLQSLQGSPLLREHPPLAGVVYDGTTLLCLVRPNNLLQEMEV